MSRARIAEQLIGPGRVQLCSRAIELGGQSFTPDKWTAYVEFSLSHAFPVVTCDGTALHPRVVANSYRSLQHKVFDLNHLLKKYDPDTKADRILGTVVGVELTGERGSVGAWSVQKDKAQALGIRAVAAMHKNADQVSRILASHFEGDIKWTVSMEQEWILENSGFLVKQEEELYGETSDDLQALGWVYVPALHAPTELLDCFDVDEARITHKYEGRETVILFGGLDGTIGYMGVGLTPLGKEKEATVNTMLAAKPTDVELQLSVVELLKRTAAFLEV